MKKIFLTLGILMVVFVTVLLFNTFTFSSKQVATSEIVPFILTDSTIAHMQQSVRIKTISNEDREAFIEAPFFEFHRFLATTYPLVDSLLKPEVINKYSLLYTWQGSDVNAAPMVLMGHIDVVPIDEPTKNDWKVAPFSGEIIEDAIWARGSMDDKGNLIAIMESVEQLLQEGY